jgi:nifR3 family TIM-barrel protein
MSFLQTPFFLGETQLPSNIFCAPLAGCSDLPFRKMTTGYRPGLVYCEMVKMDALIRNDPHTFRMLDFEASMHPIGAQLCGSKLELAGPCARILEDLGFDVIDLNCGCPVDKVTKDGSGSALLKNPEKIGEIIAKMKAAVKIPVTVKVRAGWDSSSISAPKITKIAEEAGAQAICIHGRTRVQGYRGPADWSYIRACKEVSTKIKIIANGDVFDPVAAKNIFEATGCDAILLARGTMGQPWLIEDIYRFLKDGELTPRTSLDYKKALLQHIAYVTSYQNDRRALLDIRRIGSWYLKLSKGTKYLRESVNRSSSLAEALSHINNFAWEEVQFSPPSGIEEGCEACAD